MATIEIIRYAEILIPAEHNSAVFSIPGVSKPGKNLINYYFFMIFEILSIITACQKQTPGSANPQKYLIFHQKNRLTTATRSRLFSPKRSSRLAAF